jgi:hypothetical protein
MRPCPHRSQELDTLKENAIYLLQDLEWRRKTKTREKRLFSISTPTINYFTSRNQKKNKLVKHVQNIGYQ